MMNLFGIVLISLCAFIPAEILSAVQSYDDVLKAISTSPGKIQFENRVKDFGQIERGEDATHEFKFKNVGDGDLIIQGIHSSCGCAAVESDEGKIYKPGEEGVLKVTFDSTSFSGKVSKSVTILTNERSKSVRVLTIRAHVKNLVKVNPPLVDFGTLSSGGIAHRRVNIASVAGKPLDIKGVKHSKNLDAQLTKLADDAWALDIYVKPTMVGDYKEVLYLETSLKGLPKVPVPIVGESKGKIAYSPKYIEFGAVAENKSRNKVLKLNGVNDFKILSAVVKMEINGKPVESEEYISLDLSSSSKSIHDMKISLRNNKDQAGSVSGDIEFVTDDPSQQSINIDFFAFFQE